jgi:drug/metabolite transporter (DMT)-like permease
VLAVILATTSALAWGASDFLGGLQSRRFDALAVILCSQFVGTASLAAVVLVLGGTFPEGEGLAFILTGAALGIMALLAFYAALSLGTMSIVAPVSATGAVLPVIVGLASGERPSTVQLAGIALAIVGVVLASREPPSPDVEQARNARTALGLALLAAIGFGSYFLAVDEATKNADALPAILSGRFGALALILLAVVVMRPKLPGGRAAWPALLAIGLFDVVANALYALATEEGLLSVVGVLGSLYPAMTVALAHLVLHERLAPVQWAGIGAALAGVALIASA